MAGWRVRDIPREDAVPEVLDRRRREVEALRHNRESLPESTRPIDPAIPPHDLAVVSGAMSGSMVHLRVATGLVAPAWVGRLVAGRNDDPRIESEAIAAVCLDAFDLAAAESLAARLSERGISVFPAPLPAVSPHPNPIRRRRAAHPDPQMQARQALFKARHALEALLEQAAIPGIDRPLMVRGSIGALDNIINNRSDLDSILRAGWTDAGDPAAADFAGAYTIPPGHRGAVLGSGEVAAWFFRPLAGEPLMRLRVPVAWWKRHGGAGADLLTAWALHMLAAGENNRLGRLESRLASFADSREILSAITDLIA